jgi:hypothetical protein
MMKPSDLTAIAYRLRHSTTAKAKREIINSYPELKGKTIKSVLSLIRVQEEFIQGKTRRKFYGKKYK